MKKNIAIITSHPIQYQIPLFKKLNKSKLVKLLIFFGSRHGLASKKKILNLIKNLIGILIFLKGLIIFFQKKKEMLILFFWVLAK